MGTTEKLVQLFRAGWALQVAPHVSPYLGGASVAVITWSRRRSPIKEELDGVVGSLPVQDSIDLYSPADLARAIDEFYQRVFPVPPEGNIPEREL